MEDFTRVNTLGGADAEKRTLRFRIVFEERSGHPVKDEAINVLFGSQMLLGRDESCEIPIRDNRISRKHALIKMEADGVRLMDLGSTNGTSRNDEAVSEEIILNNRDKITVGKAITFEVRLIERDGQLTSARLATGTSAFLLSPSEILIGRSDPANRSCDLLIYDPDIELKHARIDHFYDNTFIMSMSPEKPVLVNNKAVKELEIHPGYTITLGKTRFKWEKVS